MYRSEHFDFDLCWCAEEEEVVLTAAVAAAALAAVNGVVVVLHAADVFVAYYVDVLNSEPNAFDFE